MFRFPRLCTAATFALVAAVPARLPAQDTAQAAPVRVPSVTLTLDEAIASARNNSPAYRRVLNDADPARWNVRSSTASLFLPTADVGTSFSYSGAGSQQILGTQFQQSSSTLGSGYNISLNYSLSGRTLTAPAQARAQARAVDEDINYASVQLRTDITQQYLLALQNEAQVRVAREQVSRNNDFVRLAKARYDVGQATLLDVRQAEVVKGTSDVTLLRSQQAAANAKLELFRRMGVPLPAPVEEIALTDSFPVAPPAWSLQELLATAQQQNPVIRAAAARRQAAGSNVSAARSEWFPRLSFSAGWNGFTQQYTNIDSRVANTLTSAQSGFAGCQENNQIRTSAGLATIDCLGANGLINPTTLDPAVEQAIRDQNSVFPFDFTSQPFRAQVSISLPIFTGFNRSLQIAQAKAAEADARESEREQALLVEQGVRSGLLAVETEYQSIGVQEAARQAARDQLRLAQDRYRVGIGTALELADAQAALQRAEGDYINAVYGYHSAVAALEAAVGRPLR